LPRSFNLNTALSTHSSDFNSVFVILDLLPLKILIGPRRKEENQQKPPEARVISFFV
jgi:hypothetical protein